jgi:hypothetical protein
LKSGPCLVLKERAAKAAEGEPFDALSTSLKAISLRLDPPLARSVRACEAQEA